MGEHGKHGERGKDGQHQAEDLKPCIHDSKHSIFDTNTPIVN